MRLYEGMYIVPTELDSQGWEKVEEAVKDTIARFDGEIVRMRKWSERIFASPIHKHEKGVYVLVHFMLDPDKVKKVENRIQLAPHILRALIVKIDEAYAEKSFAIEPGDEGLQEVEGGVDGTDGKEKDHSNSDNIGSHGEKEKSIRDDDKTVADDNNDKNKNIKGNKNGE